VYGIGALLSAVSPGLGVFILGNSIFEGVGTALLIPPVYILTTLLFTDMASRARAFGAISAAGGIGAATGPLIGGVITTAISWRAAFIFQVLVVLTIWLLSRHIADPLPANPNQPFDLAGAILSAVGLVLVVMGILAVDNNGWVALTLIAAGVVFLAVFFRVVRGKERRGETPLLSTSLFKNRTSNFGLITQNAQWLMLMGASFVVSAYLQVVRGYDAIQTGVIFSAVTVGLLASSIAAERLAKRHSQRTLIVSGFVLAIAGVGVLLAMVAGTPNVWAFAPGLLLLGLGMGAMLTPSVNVVQSSFAENRQGEISGLSRSVSNLGSAMGTAIAGTVLVSGIASTPSRSYALAMVVLTVVGAFGLVGALFLPKKVTQALNADPAPVTE
jgi:MFS family permease